MEINGEYEKFLNGDKGADLARAYATPPPKKYTEAYITLALYILFDVL